MNISISTALHVLTEKIEGWLIGFTASLPNLIVAVLVVTAFWFAAKFVRGFFEKFFQRFSDNGPVAKLLAAVVQVILIVTGVFVALGILNLDKTVSSLLAGAGVVGLALGFAFQEIASNFIAGILIAFRKPYNVGDILKVEGNEGKVTDINLRTTNMMMLQLCP